jgi:hypothetical protein
MGLSGLLKGAGVLTGESINPNVLGDHAIVNQHTLAILPEAPCNRRTVAS